MREKSYLVLNRRLGESIKLVTHDINGHEVVVHIDINKVTATTVKLGLDAPKNIRIRKPAF